MEYNMNKKQSNQQTIGKRIKEFRKEKGLTQEGLARKAVIPCTTLSKIESEVIKKRMILAKE